MGAGVALPLACVVFLMAAMFCFASASPRPLSQETRLIEAAGMGIPRTWNEMRAFAMAATKPPYQYGFGIPISDCNDSESSILAIIWSFGGGYFDEKGNVNFNTPETRVALQLLADMEEIARSYRR